MKRVNLERCSYQLIADEDMELVVYDALQNELARTKEVLITGGQTLNIWVEVEANSYNPPVFNEYPDG